MPVCIVGMHRSGTSMVTHILHAGGLYLGDDVGLLLSDSHNPDGYYEHRGFLALNDQLLREFGGGWDLPPDLPEGASGQPGLAPLRARASELCQPLADHEPWGWKDPRTSLTLPFWLAWQPDLSIVVCLRNPLEVAVSLSRRNWFSYERGLQLWRTYNERIVRAIDGRRHLITSYDAYFADPGAEIERLFAFVGLSPTPEAIRDAEAAVAAQMRHSSFSIDDLVEARVPDDIIALYTRLVHEATSAPRGSRPATDGTADAPDPGAAKIGNASSPTRLSYPAIQAMLRVDQAPPTPPTPPVDEVVVQPLHSEVGVPEAPSTEPEQAAQAAAEIEAGCAALQQALEEQSRHAAALEEHARRLTVMLEEKDCIIAAQDAHLTSASSQLDLAYQQIHAMQGSRAWRFCVAVWTVRQHLLCRITGHCELPHHGVQPSALASTAVATVTSTPVAPPEEPPAAPPDEPAVAPRREPPDAPSADASASTSVDEVHDEAAQPQGEAPPTDPSTAPPATEEPLHWSAIKGWFLWRSAQEEAVEHFPAGSRFVEVGTYLGRSICSLGEIIQQSGKRFQVIGVDTCRGSGPEGVRQKDYHGEAVARGGGTFAGALHKHILDCGYGDTISLIVADSLTAAGMFADASLDWVHLDARHDYASVKADIQAWLPKVKPGGWLSGDDYDAERWPEVIRAVDELLPGAEPWSYLQWRRVVA